MYLKREVTGLTESAIGLVSGLLIEPIQADYEPIQADYYMNIDIGNQSQSGANAIVLGDASVSNLRCDSDLYGLNTFVLNSYKDFSITTDDDGTAWIFVGSDSGFMGVTRLYFDTIEAILVPMDSSGE